jgi:hypothetical protein
LTCSTDCLADCGDLLCTHEETADSCEVDCPALCSDGLCTHDETAETCPEDCTVCADGLCTGTEDARTCHEDCPAECGDRACTHTETYDTCSTDCPSSCTDHDGDGHISITCSAGDDCNDSDDSVWGGAWYDSITGYLWQSPPAESPETWEDAHNYCDTLSACGYGAGSWHLPTIDELRSLIRGCSSTVTGGTCSMTDICVDCTNPDCDENECYLDGGPGPGGCFWDPSLLGDCFAPPLLWWTSSGVDGLWDVVCFASGQIFQDVPEHGSQVRCVQTAGVE